MKEAADADADADAAAVVAAEKAVAEAAAAEAAVEAAVAKIEAIKAMIAAMEKTNTVEPEPAPEPEPEPAPEPAPELKSVYIPPQKRNRNRKRKDGDSRNNCTELPFFSRVEKVVNDSVSKILQDKHKILPPTNKPSTTGATKGPKVNWDKKWWSLLPTEGYSSDNEKVKEILVAALKLFGASPTSIDSGRLETKSKSHKIKPPKGLEHIMKYMTKPAEWFKDFAQVAQRFVRIFEAQDTPYVPENIILTLIDLTNGLLGCVFSHIFSWIVIIETLKLPDFDKYFAKGDRSNWKLKIFVHGFDNFMDISIRQEIWIKVTQGLLKMFDTWPTWLCSYREMFEQKFFTTNVNLEDLSAVTALGNLGKLFESGLSDCYDKITTTVVKHSDMPQLGCQTKKVVVPTCDPPWDIHPDSAKEIWVYEKNGTKTSLRDLTLELINAIIKHPHAHNVECIISFKLPRGLDIAFLQELVADKAEEPEPEAAAAAIGVPSVQWSGTIMSLYLPVTLPDFVELSDREC